MYEIYVIVSSEWEFCFLFRIEWVSFAFYAVFRSLDMQFYIEHFGFIDRQLF